MRTARKRKSSVRVRSLGRSKVTRRRVKNSRFKKIIVFILLSLLSLGFIGGYFVYNRLNERLVGAESSSTTDQTYYTVAFGVVDDFNNSAPTIKKLEYKIFDLNNKKITSFSFPPDYKIGSIQGFGNEPVAKLYALGMLNHDAAGSAQFVNNVLYSIFAFPVDRYVFVSEEDAWTWEGLFKEGQFMNVFTKLLYISSQNPVFTNMELDEIYQTSQFIKGLPEERLISAEYREDLAPVVDFNLRELTLGSKFSEEVTNIAVLNASSQGGVASFAARVISNLGGRVVSVDNSDNKFGESFLVATDPTLYSVGLLKRLFGVSKVIDKEAAKQYVTDNELYRADILLIIGE